MIDISCQSVKKKEIQKFARYEFKYLLNKKLSDVIEAEVQYFMSYDGHVHPELGNRYFVRSLYFDNFIYSNFFEKVDGIRKRRKYRIRTYSQEDNLKTPVFLEEKGRTNERTYKLRTMIKRGHLNYFLQPNSNSRALLEQYPDNELVEEFVFASIRKKLKPRVLVDYNRRPYISDYGLYFRLTFDSHILSTRANILYPTVGNDFTPRECRAGYTILEVKFERSIPPWFHRIIQNYNLRRLSISKFVIGMEEIGMAEDV